MQKKVSVVLKLGQFTSVQEELLVHNTLQLTNTTLQRYHKVVKDKKGSSSID